MRRLTLLPLLVVLLAFPGMARASRADEARDYVDAISIQVLSVMRAEVRKETKQAKLESIFAGTVDVPWVARFVLGRHWRLATPEQRERYLREYQGFLVSHYASRFTRYSGGSYKILDATEDEEGKVTVAMEIRTPEDRNVTVEYRLHTTADGSFKVFDVVVEGVSLITTQRSEFASVLGNNGLDYLIDQLANRTLSLDERNNS